jgi:gamma-glutamyltranspeptidase / glutathione hydrolase
MKIYNVIICSLIAMSASHLNSTPAAAQSVGVATSADPRATEAGMEILRKGGSASDAAMAMMLALTVVEPQSSGIGGGGFLLVQDGPAGKIETINGRETAPAAAKADRFLGADGKPLSFNMAFPGGKSVGVPGNISLMAKAHNKWGKLRWSAIFQPAIRLAEDGFVVNATLEKRLVQMNDLISKFPTTQQIYWVNGTPVKQGMTIKNPELAMTLRKLAKGGPRAFYSGEIARGIVSTVTKDPVAISDMTLRDVVNYRAALQAPVCGNYRSYKICSMAPPSSGATTILQILGMLERFDLTALGKDNPQSWHLLSEAMMLAYADRDKYLADPAFVNVPVKGLLDNNYLNTRSALIDPAKAANSYIAGNPPGAVAQLSVPSGEVSGTSHFVAVDKFGSVATMTSTIEGPFGSGLVSGGFFLNNELTDFSFSPTREDKLVANRVQGGKRPLSSMSPTIVYDKNGKALLALGSAGGKRIIMHVAKTLIGVIDFKLSLSDAIALPNLFFNEKSVMIETARAPIGFAEKMASFGRPVSDLDFPSKVNGAQLTAKGWVGAADPRSEGSAITQ